MSKGTYEACEWAREHQELLCLISIARRICFDHLRVVYNASDFSDDVDDVIDAMIRAASPERE